MTERALGFEVMASRATLVAGAVEFSLVFIEPRLPGRMGVAVMAIFRRVAKSPIDIVALVADVILLGQSCKVMGCISVLPGRSGRHPGPGRAEVALAAFSIQIMTGTTFKGTRTVKPGLIFVQPFLSHGMDMAIVAARRTISERAIKIMACQAHRVLHGENHIVMRNGAVLPVASSRNPGPGLPEVALAAFSIQIMTGTTFKGTRTVKICLFFVKP